jgi:hypothetical protein
MARADISERVAALGDLSRPELIALWVKHYGVDPPIGIRQPMLLRAAARHIQEKQLGGLSPTAKRLLKIAVKRVASASDTVRVDAGRVIDQAAGAEASAASLRALPQPGARLIREWNGRRYIVEVIDGGFVMDGTVYRSLTAIALKITGAKWSGPRFFGL